MPNKKTIGIFLGIVILIAAIYYYQKKQATPCPCLKGQDAIIDKLTVSELKEQILSMDNNANVDKTSAELKNVLKELIAKNK